MTENHPIRPPHELVQAFLRSNPVTPDGMTYEEFIATRFARWGADTELDACCKILRGEFNYHHLVEPLRAARRPKPPSLKEQALLQLDTFNADLAMHSMGCDLSQIRRALEALPDD